MGRPRLHNTEEERLEAQREYNRNYRDKLAQTGFYTDDEVARIRSEITLEVIAEIAAELDIVTRQPTTQELCTLLGERLRNL